MPNRPFWFKRRKIGKPFGDKKARNGHGTKEVRTTTRNVPVSTRKTTLKESNFL